MASYQIFKETALPGTLVANSIYLITSSTNADYLEVYVSDGAGTATRRVPTEADIQALIQSEIGSLSGLEIVADIAAREALNPTSNTQVMVLDASADASVDSGAATYIWDNSGSVWRKVSEAESMDVTVNWANIVGTPTSSAAAIDAAVVASHTHANKTELDNIGEDADGDMTYNGDAFVKTGSINW